MLQGKELGAAIRDALAKKGAVPGAGRVGPSALARALGMSQPSASELLTTGRLAKEKVPLLLDYFSDVVGPDHFGLPFSKFEADFLKSLRKLPLDAQLQLHAKVVDVAARISAALQPIEVEAETNSLGEAGSDMAASKLSRRTA